MLLSLFVLNVRALNGLHMDSDQASTFSKNHYILGLEHRLCHLYHFLTITIMYLDSFQVVTEQLKAVVEK